MIAIRRNCRSFCPRLRALLTLGFRRDQRSNPAKPVAKQKSPRKTTAFFELP